MKNIKLLFDGRENFLKIYDTGGDIVKKLTSNDPAVCPLINSSIKLKNELGRGEYGIVFSIDIDGNQKDYVAKVVDPGAIYKFIPYGKPGSTKKNFQSLLRKEGYSNDIISKLLKYDDNRKNPIMVPTYLQNICESMKIYNRSDGRGLIHIPEGSLICKPSITEFILSLLCGELYKKSISVNFIDIFYFATCSNVPNVSDIRQYTFMERIGGSLGSLLKSDFSKDIPGVYLQIVHAINTYQNIYGIVHGDLHTGNVFVIETDKVVWEKSPLASTDILEYEIDENSSFYVSSKYIVKIGDFGFGCKFSPRMVCNSGVIGEEYSTDNGGGVWIPNFYNTNYDLIHITAAIHRYYPNNEFIKAILIWMLGLKNDVDAETFRKIKDEHIRAAIGERPAIKSLTTRFAHVSPLSLLKNKVLMVNFIKKPSGKTIKAGEMTKPILQMEIPEIKLKKYEIDYLVPQNLPEIQKDGIGANQRKILMEWLWEVGVKTRPNFNVDTILFAIHLTDVYTSRKSIEKKNYQLLGCICMSLASQICQKYIKTPDDYVYLADGSFDIKQFRHFLPEVREVVQDHIPSPVASKYVNQYLSKISAPPGNLKVTGFQDLQKSSLRNLAISSLQYDSLKYIPSVLAVSAILNAQRAAKVHADPTLTEKNIENVSGLSKDDYEMCVKDMATWILANKNKVYI